MGKLLDAYMAYRNSHSLEERRADIRKAEEECGGVGIKTSDFLAQVICGAVIPADASAELQA